MLIGLCAVGPDHPWRAEAEHLGSVTWIGDPAGLGLAALSPLDLLLADAARLTPQDLSVLRAFRVQRPETRIVVSVPADAAPGGPVLAGLVALGIYDLCTIGTPLADALTRPATYADAARWGLPPEDPVGGAKADLGVKEVVRERVVATSARPTLITVSGLLPGVGATSAAAGLSAWLAGKGHAVAFWSAQGDFPALPADVPAFGAPETPAGLIRRHEWAYIVADTGTASGAGGDAEADLCVVVLPGTWARAQRAWSPEAPAGHDAPVMAVAGPGPESALVAQQWADAGYGPAFAWPTAKQTLRTWEQVLSPVLPTVHPGRAWWRRPPAAARGGGALPAPGAAPPDPGHHPGPAVSPVVIYHEGPYGDTLGQRLVRRLGSLIEWSFIAAIVGAIVWIAGLAAQQGLLTGEVGTWALIAHGWVATVLRALGVSG